MIGKLVLVKYVLRILGNYNTGGKERENGNKKNINIYTETLSGIREAASVVSMATGLSS